ncbi:MAG TPA: hypothetical protein DEP35_16065 [Deltaproteobacteria bacterium]|jgi:hypothetical protein|nr:hypothetical protein [Deltaproteobacteria bacterium]
MEGRSELEEFAACALCRAQIALGDDRSFAFGNDQVMCWECSLGRGGRYDAQHERWEVAPHIADLLGETE